MPLDIKQIKRYQLHNSSQYIPKEDRIKKSIIFETIKLLLILSLLIFIGYLYYNSQKTKEIETFSKILEPYNGILVDRLHQNNIVPLTIYTRGGKAHYIKLESTQYPHEYIGIYVRANENISIKVPIGSYTLKYAIGDDWKGLYSLFGYLTQYQQLEDTLYFHHSKEAYYGHTIQLYNTLNGNVHEQTINANSF